MVMARNLGSVKRVPMKSTITRYDGSNVRVGGIRMGLAEAGVDGA